MTEEEAEEARNEKDEESGRKKMKLDGTGIRGGRRD